MAPTKCTKKGASCFIDKFIWSGDTSNDSDFRPIQDYDSESSSDECSITSGDEQVLAEGCARKAAEDETDSEVAADTEVAANSEGDADKKYVCSLDAHILVN
jgi:hypothetical protein